MLTDLASVSVVNVLPLGSKSTFVGYPVSMEPGPGPIPRFPSGMMLGVSVEGHRSRKGLVFPVLLCSLLRIPLLCVAFLWPGSHSMKQPTAPRGQWLSPAPPQVMSQSVPRCTTSLWMASLTPRGWVSSTFYWQGI